MATCFTLEKGISTILTKQGVANCDIVFSNGIRYKGGYCGRYALLYQNAYGGWDSFLIEGTVVKNGNYTQSTYAKAYDNSTLDRETTNYANVITYTYACTTGWLSDEESERLAKHLLSSPDIYLQDIQEDRIIPVTMQAGAYKFKTYQNEGKKLVNYNFTLKESNSKTIQH
jgi:hypothetical protein